MSSPTSTFLLFGSLLLNTALDNAFASEPQNSMDYLRLTALEKQELIYAKAAAVPYTSKQMAGQKSPGPLELLKLLSPAYLMESFTNPMDEFPKAKTKVIHTFGAVAKVEFRINQATQYTGLFAPNYDGDGKEVATQGIIRFSLAKTSGSYTPGLGLKLLVDGNETPQGRRSENIFAMYSLDGQGSNKNFFANSFETKINAPRSPELQLLAVSFKKALILLDSSHQDPTFQAATDLAKVTNTGKDVLIADAPYSLIFVPTVQMGENTPELRAELATEKYAPGVKLYDVYVRDFENSTPSLLGEVVLKSRFVSSEYGDRVLYFRHNID